MVGLGVLFVDQQVAAALRSLARGEIVLLGGTAVVDRRTVVAVHQHAVQR